MSNIIKHLKCLLTGHKMSLKYWLQGAFPHKRAFIRCKRCGKSWIVERGE